MTLDQLAALSDEIAALARAGVPLDRGLVQLGREMPGRLGRAATQVGQRLEAGEPLEQVIGQLDGTLPPAYGSLLAAGLRSGRLPAALEGASRTARLVSQLRRSLGLALVYPLIVLTLTWTLAVFVVLWILPVMVDMLQEFGLLPAGADPVLEAIIRTAPLWGLLVPLIAGAWLAWAWHRSVRLAAGADEAPHWALGGFAALVRLARASRYATLAELLAVLLQNDVPLPEAVALASGAIGSARLAAAGRTLSERLAQGELAGRVPDGFPPVIATMLLAGHSQPRLVRSLVRTAEVYREEASRRSQWLALYVPLVLVIGICGGVVLLYALLALGPWLMILRGVSRMG